MDQPRVVIDQLTFLECPRWRDGRLWASEMPAHRVVAVTPAGDLEVMHELDDEPGGLGWTPDGDLLVVSTAQRTLLRSQAGQLEKFASLEPAVAFRANDMLVDPRGHAYIGDWGYDFAGGQTYTDANVARVGPDGVVAVAAAGLGFPNGMALDERRGELLIAETMKERITSFRVSVDGTLADRATWAELPGRAPDGICIDDAGGLWVADPAGRSVVRVERGGRVTDVVGLDGRRPYACALGGEGGHTLFICAAESFKPEVTLARRSGALFAVDVAVGAPAAIDAQR